MKALFLDLDGTLIRTKSKEVFPLDMNDWTLIRGVRQKIENFYKLEYKIIIVSNQGGIQLGHIKEEEFEEKILNVCTELEKTIGLPQNHIAYRYCNKMYSYDRKPNPGMAYDLALEYELDLGNSVMVGDRQEDKDFAINAGIGTFIWAKDFIM